MKVRANENLFNTWKLMGQEIANLAAIVQNDMEISCDEFNEWNVRCNNLIDAIKAVKIRTIYCLSKSK